MENPIKDEITAWLWLPVIAFMLIVAEFFDRNADKEADAK